MSDICQVTVCYSGLWEILRDARISGSSVRDAVWVCTE